MKLVELAATVGEKSGVQAKMAQRVMKSLFAELLSELEAKGEVTVPTFGRFVKRSGAEGRERVIFVPRKPAAPGDAAEE